MIWDTGRAIAHTRMSSQLVLWAGEQGYFLVRTWVKRSPDNQIEIYGYNRPTYHSICRADDFDLWLLDEEGNLEWIDDGSHEAWNKIGMKWESMDKRNRWGGWWDNRDSSHCETL